MNEMLSSSPRRRRRWLLWLGAVVAFPLVQSITLTPSIDVRIVDATTGAPISDLPVTAVWQLVFTTPAGGSRSGTLKVQHLSTDANGEVDLGAAALVHAPVFPFGFRIRNASWLPALYVASDQYDAYIAAGSSRISGMPHPWSFLLFQRSSLDGTTVRLSPAIRARDPAQQRDREIHRRQVNRDIRQAEQACRKSMLCQGAGQ